jgi:hypothetical protein
LKNKENSLLSPFQPQPAVLAQQRPTLASTRFPRARSAQLFPVAQPAHPRVRPAAVTDGRAPPIILDLESETDWGPDPTPNPSSRRAPLCEVTGPRP